MVEPEVATVAISEAPSANEPMPCAKPRLRIMAIVREVTVEAAPVELPTATDLEMPLTASDARIVQLLADWHEAGRERFETAYPNLDYDNYAPKTAKGRNKYLCLDVGTSGAWMVDRVTHQIYRIKAYGVPNHKKCAGTLETVTGAQLEQWRHW